jgi:hypothetical protein
VFFGLGELFALTTTIFTETLKVKIKRIKSYKAPTIVPAACTIGYDSTDCTIKTIGVCECLGGAPGRTAMSASRSARNHACMRAVEVCVCISILFRCVVCKKNICFL